MTRIPHRAPYTVDDLFDLPDEFVADEPPSLVRTVDAPAGADTSVPLAIGRYGTR